jgi:hypothetical protein
MSHGGRRSAALVSFLVLTLGAASARAQVGLRVLRSFEAGRVEAARAGAMRRLAVPECRSLLEEYKDAAGRPLTAKLAEFGVPADQYLAMLPFLDGESRPLCGRGQSELLTVRGVARILVCPPFLQTVDRERVTAEVYVIHEMLHTLGLGENPPTSQQVTQRVKRQCAP